MSKKQRLDKQKQRQLEQQRLEEAEERREREEAKYRESRAAKRMRRAAKRGYPNALMLVLTVLMLAAFGYSGFYYGGITIVGQLSKMAENIPAHTAHYMIAADALMFVGIIMSFAGKHIIQAIFNLSGSGLFLYAAHRVVADIRERLEKYYVEPALQEMDKDYMRYYYPIAAVTLISTIILAIALTAKIRKSLRQKRERDNAPVESIVD